MRRFSFPSVLVGDLRARAIGEARLPPQDAWQPIAGLVLDFILPEDKMPPVAMTDRLQVRVNWSPTPEATSGVETLKDTRAFTITQLDPAAVFRPVKQNAAAPIVDGYLELSERFRLMQIDVDGAGIKTKNFAQSLLTMKGAATREPERRPGAPALPDFVPDEEADLPAGPFPLDGILNPTLPADPHRFAVAPHMVDYDAERKLWYCDIVIDPGRSYFPFIRLALVRYHPISSPGAHISPIVTNRVPATHARPLRHGRARCRPDAQGRALRPCRAAILRTLAALSESATLCAARDGAPPRSRYFAGQLLTDADLRAE